MGKLGLALSLVKKFEIYFVLKILQKYWSFLQNYCEYFVKIMGYSEYPVKLL